MKRDDFKNIMDETFENIGKLFDYKNQSYGVEDDLFYNFRSTAKRILKSPHDYNHVDMFKVLSVCVDKHWVALCNLGLNDREFVKRCQGIITYMLIAIAMHKDREDRYAS